VGDCTFHFTGSGKLVPHVAAGYTTPMSITSVVFDYGSVLSWPPSSGACHRISSLSGVPEEVLLGRYFVERSAYDRGEIDPVMYWQRVVRDYPAASDQTVLEQLVELDVEIWSDPNETTIEWLPALKAEGITLAILSNMPVSFCTALEARDRWLDIFDHRIFSGRVNLNKPEPAIYELLLRTLSSDGTPVDPASVLFLDDLSANIEGARAVGISAELYSVFGGGLPEIAGRYGLPVPSEVRPPADRLADTRCAPHHHFG
jgi:putative hydrolase of the HAD superfamily